MLALASGALALTAGPAGAVSVESPLYRDGLGLDSLAAAELSVMLEMEFQDAGASDPYSEGQVPRTVGDIVRFYQRG